MLLHAMLDISEMEIMDARNAQIHAHHAPLPHNALDVSKPEINQLMVFATNVFIHVQIVLLMNNALLVYQVSM